MLGSQPSALLVPLLHLGWPRVLRQLSQFSSVVFVQALHQGRVPAFSANLLLLRLELHLEEEEQSAVPLALEEPEARLAEAARWALAQLVEEQQAVRLEPKVPLTALVQVH